MINLIQVIIYKLMTIKDKDELDKIVEYEKMLENYGRKLKKLSNDNNYVEDITR